VKHQLMKIKSEIWFRGSLIPISCA
jgi:hypothetical protein